MNALLAAEIRRYFSRRLVLGAFVLAIALATLVLVILTVRSDFRYDSTGGGITCTPTQSIQPGSPPPSINQKGPLPTDCVRTSDRALHDHRLKIGKNFSDTVGGIGVVAVFVAIVLGASFVGAEFAAGSLGAQLVFEPRRTRVVLAKAIAVGVGTAGLTVAVVLYAGLLQWIGSAWRGVVSGIDASWFAARAGDIARVAAAVALVAIASYAITVVMRRTVAAVAGLLIAGWVSNIIGVLHNWHWVAKYNPTSAFVVMAVDPRVSNGDHARVLAVGGATVSACVWVVAFVSAGVLVFGRREVR